MPTRRPMTRARRRVIRRRRQVAAAGFLLCCALIVHGGFRLAAAFSNGPVAVADDSSPAADDISPAADDSSPAADKSSPVPGLKAKPSDTARSTGVYDRASGGTARHGSGKLRTYRVEVETGTGQGAQAFATAVDATLADPASWAGHGGWSVQRVSTDDADLVIRLATPATVDSVCSTAGLDTRGYVSCRAGTSVMINLDRWLQGVPEYHGDIARYRNYVINHEVGHGLGYSHQACPGPGRPAPVMQQQTLGLNGCLPNGWPYVDGALVSGPAAR